MQNLTFENKATHQSVRNMTRAFLFNLFLLFFTSGLNGLFAKSFPIQSLLTQLFLVDCITDSMSFNLKNVILIMHAVIRNNFFFLQLFDFSGLNATLVAMVRTCKVAIN